MAHAYFAGLQLQGRWGVSSDDVLLARALGEGLGSYEAPPILFLPTVTYGVGNVVGERITRVYIARYRSPGDYLALTRPLYLDADTAFRLAESIRARLPSTKIVASIATPKLSELRALASSFSKAVDAFEVDLGVLGILYGQRKSFEAFALDIVEEFVSAAPSPVVVKVSPGVPLSDAFLKLLVDAGVGGIVFSPHPVYAVGKSLFRVHSPLLSEVYSLIWARLITELNVSTAIVSDKPLEEIKEHDPITAFDIVLFDTALMFKRLKIAGTVENDLPLNWRSIATGLLPSVTLTEEEVCADVCPYGALNPLSAGETTDAVADSRCDLCGLCLSLCKTARLVRVLSPE